ncbi:hypothetical protein SCA6_014688, partial [Theobroma cacao]
YNEGSFSPSPERARIPMVPVDLGAREHKKDSYLSLNSFGHVPALQDGGLKLFESRAISKYIASTYSDKGIELRV